MSQHHVLQCRRCERANRSAGGRTPFIIPGSRPHYAPDRPIRLEHLGLDITLEPEAGIVEGWTRQTYRIVGVNQVSLTLDQIGLEIRQVRIDDEGAKFSITAGSLRIELPPKIRQMPSGAKFELAIEYQALKPQRGLYFTGPNAFQPNRPYQVWSQGQDEDNRHWMPLPDYPNQKATTEIRVSVPKGYTAVSNGALLSRGTDQGRDWFHYRLGMPHVTYLITLAVAKFSEWSDAGPRGLPVQYFVEPGREADGKRAFGNTPRMIEAFEQKTGIPYPYEKYSQVAVQDFIFGGMENTSATTQTDRTLHDERAHLDFSSDPLVSHELAHQWFGDLITCREWSHGWLNEGFATFMERVWIECNPEGFGGELLAREEAKYYSYCEMKEYLAEDANHYRRPIVCRSYVEPIDLFDRHLYNKGGLVLNLLRAQLGEAEFWRAVNLYINRHKGGSVETIDLIRAVEDATGRNFRKFFDQWVFSAGHPEFEVSYTWNADRKVAEVVIEQKQTQGKDELMIDGFVTPLFDLPVNIDLILEDGRKISHSLPVSQMRERIFLPLDSKPLVVRFDPGFTIPKTLKFPRPLEMLVHQLVHDADCMGRIEAARELLKLNDPKGLDALATALREDAFWGVQAEIAAVLGELRSDRARDALVAGLRITHPKARRAVVKALGTYRDLKAAMAIQPLAEKDPSYFVEAEAIGAYAHAISAFAERAEDLEEFLLRKLKVESHLEVVRSAALQALTWLPGIERGERPKAFDLLLDWTLPGHLLDARLNAVGALGKIARSARASECTQIFERFAKLTDEENFRMRMWLVATLSETERPEAMSLLTRIQSIDTDGRVKRGAGSARQALLTAGSTPESVQKLREAVEKLEEEQRRLKGRVEEFPPSTPAPVAANH